jgi:hypothetical protein
VALVWALARIWSGVDGAGEWACDEAEVAEEGVEEGVDDEDEDADEAEDEGDEEAEGLGRDIEQHGSTVGAAAAAGPPGAGRQYTSSAKPFFLANSRRTGLMSTATTRRAPRCFARAHARRPIAPTPNTRTDSRWEEEPRLQRREAWISTERGSASAASSNETSSGSLWKEARR